DLNNIDLNNIELNLNVYGKIAQIYKDYKVAQATAAAQRTYYNTQKDLAKNEMEQARVQYENILEKYQNQKILYEYGAVAKAEFNNTERQLSISELAYKSKQKSYNELPQYQLIEAETNLASLEQLLKETISLSIMDLERSIQKMQRDLMNNSEIVASTSGRVLEMQVKKGSIVQAGSVICTIGEEREQTDALEASVYVPVEQGKKIRPGMEVNISPTTVKKEEYGFMLGNVVSVSQYPASTQGMMLTLGNNDLVRQLSGEGAPIEVKVKLVMDSSTQSGYKWSTPNGAPLTIDDGTFCLGEIKVEEKRPISMVIPFIKKILPL
ncbi:MAG TPA: NHLP bacteriocin system secretion protein, partial [Syntrophomonas sp.]|nr:NHLP bacteriocin system secretion protein [Syntrophomonas sp.]